MTLVLTVLQIVSCLILIATVMVQESPKGQSGALTGSGDTDSHYDKIKGRTSGAILKKITIASALFVAISTFAINWGV